MFYKIHVMKNGGHLFSTDKESIVSEKKLEEVYKEIYRVFPRENGYMIFCTMVKDPVITVLNITDHGIIIR